jgi:hypothetical protein
MNERHRWPDDGEIDRIGALEPREHRAIVRLAGIEELADSSCTPPFERDVAGGGAAAEIVRRPGWKRSSRPGAPRRDAVCAMISSSSATRKVHSLPPCYHLADLDASRLDHHRRPISSPPARADRRRCASGR